MLEKKECFLCGKEIEKEDKYVLLATISPRINDKHYFHFECFKKNHDDKVNQKARNIVQGMQKKAIGMFSGIKEHFGNVQGMEQLESTINIDLSPEIPKITGEILTADEIVNELNIEEDKEWKKKNKPKQKKKQ